MFRTDQSPDPMFTDTLELDLGSVVPSLAGSAKRPQDRVPLTESKKAFRGGAAVVDEERRCARQERHRADERR